MDGTAEPGYFALVLSSPGELELQAVPKLGLEGHGIIVQMDYSSIQPLDGEMFFGRCDIACSSDAILGCEGVGRVAETSDPEEFPIGCRVAFIYRRFGEEAGCWRTEVLVDSKSACVVRLPTNLAPQSAAAGLTSTVLALACLRHFKAGDCVIIAPACGGTGLSLLQLAMLRGMRAIGLLRGSARLSWISREYGASGLLSLVDVLEDSWVDLLGALVGAPAGGAENASDGSGGADGIIDGCGGHILLESASVLRPRGCIVRFGSVAGGTDEAALNSFAQGQQLRIVNESARNALEASDCERHLEGTLQSMAKGHYRPNCWQLVEWQHAMQTMIPQLPTSRFATQVSSGKRVGRILLKFGNETPSK